MPLFSNLRSRLANSINPNRNLYYDAFLKLLGGSYTQYDTNAKTYLEKGYGINPDVYAVINQMSSKTAMIPFTVKKVEDKKAKNKLSRLEKACNYSFTPQQFLRKTLLETKAFDENELPFPLERPNSTQSWSEIFALFKTFFRSTGNFYLYMMRPENGANSGVPNQVFVLPSHMMKIVIKNDIDMIGVESPIDSYMLIEGQSFIEFPAEDVIHVKMPNPFYDQSGSHLYGLSPLKAGLRNIQSSNEGIDNNNRTLKNSGAFGFIHGKGATPLQETQAKALKERLKEMDKDPGRLSKIAGISAEVGFTRISLTTDELKPFDYLKFDQKAICNVLGWSDILLNNDDRGDYGGTITEIKKQVVVDNIMPDLKVLAEALNDQFIPLFKGYENSVIEWDVSDLPEMQGDLNKMSEWLSRAKDDAVITGNEYRMALKYPKSDNSLMEELTTSKNLMTLEEALDSTFNINDAPTIP